ncbi:MAG: DUF4838 domain-containing protein [Planctomycetota bacterium]|nr:DUF4838 domain-containing protein [Planctomycetota bacterium]
MRRFSAAKAAFLWGLAASPLQAGLVLSEHTSGHILLPVDSTETERFAATELQRYVKMATGCKLKFAQEQKTAEVNFHVGKTVLGLPLIEGFASDTGKGTDSFRIRIADSEVILAGGGDRGTLYSVYQFLEKFGCRWFMPGDLGEVVPRHERVEMDATDEIHVPDFILREIDMSTQNPEQMDSLIDWAVKNRLNRMYGLRDYHLRVLPEEQRNAWSKRGGYVKWQRLCHNFQWFVPSSKYFETNSEYFALYNGRRIPMGTQANPTKAGGNLCTTHPDVVRLTTDYAIDWFNQNPLGTVVPLNPNDGAVKWCECERCRQLGGKNFVPGSRGSMTRRMVTFANEVARLVRPIHPDRLLSILAYSNYIEPVPEMTLEPNLMVTYCYHGCYAHGPGQCDLNEEPRRQFEQWAKSAPGRLGLWEYFLIGNLDAADDAAALLPLASRARDSIRYFKSKGAQYYFAQSSQKYQRANPFIFYSIARLLWKTDTDYEDLLKAYCQQMYGKAGDEVAVMFQNLERSLNTAEWHPQVYREVTMPSLKVFTDEFYTSAATLFEPARSKNLKPAESARLEILHESVSYTKAQLEKEARVSSKRAAASLNVPAPQPDTPARPVRGKVTYVRGPAGRAGKFTGPVDYSSAYIKGNAGTVELWYQLPRNAVTMPHQFLLGVGENSPDWFCLGISEGRIGFLYKSGQKPFSGQGEFYSHTGTEVQKQQEGEWHHLAIVWAHQGRDHDLVMLFVDGELREKKANANLGQSFGTPYLRFGGAGMEGSEFRGALDEIRISNYPKTIPEILEGYREVKMGKALRKDAGTLLLLNFEDTLTGQNQTVRGLDDERLKDRVSIIVEGF